MRHLHSFAVMFAAPPSAVSTYFRYAIILCGVVPSFLVSCSEARRIRESESTKLPVSDYSAPTQMFKQQLLDSALVFLPGFKIRCGASLNRVPIMFVRPFSFVCARTRLVADLHLNCPSDFLEVISPHKPFLRCRRQRLRKLSLVSGKEWYEPRRPVGTLVSIRSELIRGSKSLVVTLLSRNLGP